MALPLRHELCLPRSSPERHVQIAYDNNENDNNEDDGGDGRSTTMGKTSPDGGSLHNPLLRMSKKTFAEGYKPRSPPFDMMTRGESQRHHRLYQTP